MFENLFSGSAQVWTGLIAAGISLPLLIHLINMMRHKRIKWAAMEFLLKSHRKHRNWVWLKQLLLLLSRMALLLLALFMLAQVGCENDRISRLLGGTKTHHYVLLDDSFSMGDRNESGRALDRALSTLGAISARAKSRQNQFFSLYRYSQTAEADAGIPEMKVADIDNLIVDTNFDRTIETAKSGISLSQSATTVERIAEHVADIIQSRSDENAIVYLLSDFREKDWNNSDAVRKSLKQIEASGGAIELISCVESEHKNLSIERLSVAGNVRAAQTPLMMEVTIRNHSDSVARQVQVDIESRQYDAVDRTTRSENVSPEIKSLPTVFIDSIDAGQAVTQSFPVFFGQAGHHAVVATLGNDAVETDNQRFCDVSVSTSANVLLVENPTAGQASAGQIFSILLNPVGTTGLETTLVGERFLRDCTAEQLGQFDSVFLFDIEALSESAVSNLESYVNAGGGIAFFAGPSVNLNFYNDILFKDGKGLFPLPLDKIHEIDESEQREIADIQPVDHPIFAPALSVKNSLLNLVQINTVIKPPLEWVVQPREDTTKVLATVRGSQNTPLMVQKRFGDGKSVAILTTAGPAWNNWLRNATYLPIMLFLQNDLASGRHSNHSRLVGEPIEYQRSKRDFQAKATLHPELEGERTVEPIDVTKDESGDLASTLLPLSAGVYETWWYRVDGTIVTDRKAVNVDTRESNLKIAGKMNVLNRLSDVSPNWTTWDKFNPEPKIKPASILNRLLFCLLIAVIIGEQILAYATNYHHR